MKKKTRRWAAAVCAWTVTAAGMSAVQMPQTVFAAESYRTRDPFYNFNSGYHYYTSEHFQFIWGNSGDASRVTTDFLRKNAENLERCWDIYVNQLGMNECAESVEAYLRDGNKYKLNIYLSGTGLADRQDDWAYMSYDNQGFPFLFCCVDAMQTDPASWVMPHEFGHAITAHQLGWNRNKYSNTWWEALGNWFREQWIYNVAPEYGWENDEQHGFGTDFFETYLKNLCFTSPFGRDYYAAWVLMQYLTENPDHLEGYGANFVRTMLQEGKDDEYPLLMIDRLAPADIKETLGHYAKRMATLDFGQQTAYRKRLDLLLRQGAWNWQQIYTMPDQIDGTAQSFAVPTERAPQASGLNIVPLEIKGDRITVTLEGRSPLAGADWRGCIVIEDAAGKTHYSELIANGETGSLDVPAGAVSAYLTVIATPDASLYCPSGLHWHNDSDEFGETRQPFFSKHRYPYIFTLEGAGIQTRPLNGIRGHQHPNGGGFVADTAHVDDSVYVGEHAAVIGYANVTGNVVIDGYAMVAENAKISGNVYVGDCAMIMGSAKASGNAKILESACIWGNYTVQDSAVVKGDAFCMANGTAKGNAILDGDYYDDGGNTAQKGVCCGWYGTQTYLDARPDIGVQYMNYSFDTDSVQVIADAATGTYALPIGAAWEAERTGAQGVMTLDGKDDYIDIDSSFCDFTQPTEYQFAALWRGGAAEQKLFYAGDAENYMYFTPENANGHAAFVMHGAQGTVTAELDAPLTAGAWSVIRLQIGTDNVTVQVGDTTVQAALPAGMTVKHTAGASDGISVIGRGMQGEYFNGSLDFVRVYSDFTEAPQETYTETEAVKPPEQPAGLRGDVNCDDAVDVADAVLLARALAEDSEAVITVQGMQNADCNRNGNPDTNDVTLILKYVALMIPEL
ncbi:MAG TPA: hypothetical protein DCG49_06635 [Ruminococcus sp.]|nr:hypothetical protein [Ruminococcus sp.]